jgi:hypothetical protein
VPCVSFCTTTIRRLALTALAAAAVAFVVGGVSRAQADGHHSTNHTLTLTETDTGFHEFDISHTKNGEPGDGFIFHGNLSSGSKRVGTIDVSCALVLANQTYCTGIFHLPGGTLAASAIVKNTATPITHVAITGGTGRYAKVRGQAVSTPTGDSRSKRMHKAAGQRTTGGLVLGITGGADVWPASAGQRRSGLGEPRGVVGGAGGAADGEELHRVVAGCDLARLTRADPCEHARHQPVLLAAGVQRGAAGEDGVDLLLAVVGVIVHGVVLEMRRELLDLHPEGAHAQGGAGAAEAAAVGGVELLDLLHGDVGHRFPPRCSCRPGRPAAVETNDRGRIRQAGCTLWR